MTAPYRFLAWLALPLFALCSANLLADTLEGAPQALHLLDYIGADYPATVQAGKVVDESEYREQLEFTQRLEGLIVALPAKPEKAELTQGVGALRSAITAHQDGDEVARLARQLGARLAVAYEVSQAPVITPDPARGAPLYAQNCSVCHGDSGAGDGPAGVGLEPAPANLRDGARLDHLSLYAIYNTLGMGVEGTDMPAFADQLDDRQRWDLATYIASFSADPAAAKSGQTFNLADLARQTPAEILAAQGPEAAATFRAQRAQPPQVQRGPAQLLDYTATTLDKSIAAYRAGDHDQAYDLSVAAYLEGFELVESSLDNVDANVRKDTEKALMAYRQSLQDGLSVEQAEQRLDAAKAKLTESADLLGGDGEAEDERQGEPDPEMALLEFVPLHDRRGDAEALEDRGEFDDDERGGVKAEFIGRQEPRQDQERDELRHGKGTHGQACPEYAHDTPLRQSLPDVAHALLPSRGRLHVPLDRPLCKDKDTQRFKVLQRSLRIRRNARRRRNSG